jgi:hypothetical protein
MLRKNTMKMGRIIILEKVLKEVTMKKTIFWDIMLCRVLGVRQYFREMYGLYPWG